MYEHPGTLLVHVTVLLFANRVISIVGVFTHLQKGQRACVQDWDEIIHIPVPDILPITQRFQKKTKDF